MLQLSNLLFRQVGNLSTESRFWGYPENFTQARPSYYVPTNYGVGDLVSHPRPYY